MTDHSQVAGRAPIRAMDARAGVRTRVQRDNGSPDDQEVRRMLQEAHQQAYDLECEHREQLDHLAAALLQEDTLDARRVMSILAVTTR